MKKKFNINIDLCNLDKKEIISFIRYILNNPLSPESHLKAKILSKNLQVKAEDYFEFHDYISTVRIDKLLSYLLPLEILNIQSNTIKHTVLELIDRYNRGDISLNELFKERISIHEIKKKNKEIKKNIKPSNQKDFKYKKLINMKRDAFEYKKIMDYQEFELNHNFAFECAKRKFPVLYIVELNYCTKMANNIFQHIGSNFTKKYPNEKDGFDPGLITPGVYRKVLDKMFSEIENGHSFLNIFNRYYETEFNELNESELEDHLEDFVPYIMDSYEFYDNKIKRALYTFKTPRLINAKSWEVDVRLNLALPLDQLVEYVKHIKRTLPVRTYRNDTGIIKDEIMPDNSAHILFGNFHKNIRSKRDARKTFADMLFVYDCLLEGIEHTEIARALQEHRFQTGEKELTESTMIDMVTAYSELAQRLITDMHFVTLIEPKYGQGS